MKILAAIYSLFHRSKNNIATRGLEYVALSFTIHGIINQDSPSPIRKNKMLIISDILFYASNSPAITFILLMVNMASLNTEPLIISG